MGWTWIIFRCFSENYNILISRKNIWRSSFHLKSKGCWKILNGSVYPDWLGPSIYIYSRTVKKIHYYVWKWNADLIKKKEKGTLRWKIRVRANIAFYSHCIYTCPSIHMYFYLTNIESCSMIHLSTPSNPYHRSHEFFRSTLTRGTILFIGWTIWVGRVHGAALRVSNSDFH